MAEACKCCAACGMEFTRPEDHALGDVSSIYCRECANPDGSLKSYQEVHALITKAFIRSQGIDREAAKEMASELMAKLPAWCDDNSDSGQG